MRILAFHAHPDDAEALAGGTLTLLAAQGHEVVIATMTPGDCGSAEYAPEQIAATRRREAGAAAALLGARYVCAEFRDLAIFNDEPSRRRVTEILRRTRPDLVLAAAPDDPQCDHQAAASLVLDCASAAATPNYRTGAPNAAPTLPKIPHLYFMDPPGGGSAAPDFVVDIGPVFPRKQATVYGSALGNYRLYINGKPVGDDYFTPDKIESQITELRQRGALAGIELGEGFRLCRGQGYPQSPLLEELLGGDVRPVVAG